MIRTTIYQQLANDAELTGLLAERPDHLGTGPGIYEAWAPDGAVMPYLNLTYTFTPGNHAVKRLGSLDVDIFIDSYDTVFMERIQKRIIELLDLRIFDDPDDGPIRVYLDAEIDIPESEPNVTHWNVTFNLIHWRKSFIQHLNNR
jgi:hypothetical protein